MRWQQTIGKNVIDTSTAESIGKVDGLILDPAESRIVGVLMANKVVSWSDMGSADGAGVGKDAATMNGTGAMREASSDLERRTFEGAANPIKKRVISEEGFELGTVGDIDFDGRTGEVRELILGDDEVAGSRLIGIGSYAVMVSSPQRASKSAEGLSSLSHAELYEMAKDRGITDRSNMSKKELREALE